MRAEHKTNSFSEEKKNDQKKIRAMSLLNRTNNKKMETKMFDRTFDASSLKNSTLPPRELVSEQTFKGTSLDKQQAMTLFNSLQVRKDKLKVSSPRKFKFASG